MFKRVKLGALVSGGLVMVGTEGIAAMLALEREKVVKVAVRRSTLGANGKHRRVGG